MKAIYVASDPQGFAFTATTASVTWGITHWNNVDIVTPRATFDEGDWRLDFESEAGRTLPQYRQLGILPLGFSDGLPQTYFAISGQLRPEAQVMFGGHSLAGARAPELAGMHILHGGKVARIVLCAPPRAGTATLKAILDKAGVPIGAYKNRADPVCDTPEPTPWWPWVDMAPLMALNVAPSKAFGIGPGHSLDPDHNIDLYIAGIKQIEAAT